MIILYGVPGSGKTSLSRALGEELRLSVTEADKIRTKGKMGRSLEKDPFFFLPTTEAYQAIGERTPQNVIKGLLEVRGVYRNIIDEEIKLQHGDFIIESAFLDPEHLKSNSQIVLLTIPLISLHRERFLIHRTEDAFTNGQFDNARILQDFLIGEAAKLGIPILENNGNIEDLVAKWRTLKNH